MATALVCHMVFPLAHEALHQVAGAALSDKAQPRYNDFGPFPLDGVPLWAAINANTPSPRRKVVSETASVPITTHKRAALPPCSHPPLLSPPASPALPTSPALPSPPPPSSSVMA